MRTIEAQVAAVRAMLCAATGTEPRTGRGSGKKSVRIEVDLPDELTVATRVAILTALAIADRYGHTSTQEGDIVWAELDKGVVS